MRKILSLQMLNAGSNSLGFDSTSSVNCFAGDSFNSNCSVNCGPPPDDTTTIFTILTIPTV
jgi:hypothetical protein